MTYRIKLRGYRVKNGKVEKIQGYGLDASKVIRQKKCPKKTWRAPCK